MSLETVKAPGGKVMNAACLEKLLAFNQYPEVAEYIASGVNKLVDDHRFSATEQGQQWQKIVEDFSKNVAIQSRWDDAWTGIYRDMTAFFKLQTNLAEMAVKDLKGSIQGPLKMDFAISPTGEFVRGYASAAGASAGNTQHSCDVLFNAWLAQNHLFSKKGQIYLSSDTGTILKDAKGNPIQAKGSDFQALMQDKNKGFQAFLGKKGIILNAKDRSTEIYPTKTEEKPAKLAKPAKAKKVSAKAAEPAAPKAPSRLAAGASEAPENVVPDNTQPDSGAGPAS